MKTKIILLLAFVIGFATNCRKEKDHSPSGDPDCLTYPEVSVGGVGIGFKGYQTVHSNFENDYHLNPIYNPLNENEFLYTRTQFDTIIWKDKNTVMKHNLVTGKSEVFLTDKRTDMLRFTPDGRIVYIMDKNHYGIMNADGSDKQLFLQVGVTSTDFTFDHTMSRMIMSYPYENSVITILYHLNENRTDTFVLNQDNILFRKGDWSDLDSLVTLSFDSNFGVSTVDFVNKSMSLFFSALRDPYARTHNVKWHPDNETVYFANDGYGIYRYRAGVLTPVKSNCDNKVYRELSISPSGNKMLVERMNRVKVLDTRLQYQYRIAIMNIDGSGEVLLDLE